MKPGATSTGGQKSYPGRTYRCRWPCGFHSCAAVCLFVLSQNLSPRQRKRVLAALFLVAPSSKNECLYLRQMVVSEISKRTDAPPKKIHGCRVPIANEVPSSSPAVLELMGTALIPCDSDAGSREPPSRSGAKILGRSWCSRALPRMEVPSPGAAFRGRGEERAMSTGSRRTEYPAERGRHLTSAHQVRSSTNDLLHVSVSL